MRHLVSVPAGVVIAALIGVTLIGVALLGVGCSDGGSDNVTGGGTPEGMVAVALLVSEVVCPDSYADTLTERVTADLRFVSVHGGAVQSMTFESPGVMAVNVEPGEYEVRVRSGRCDGEVIMPGTVVVGEAGSLVVQHQAAAGSVPSMSIAGGTLNLINLATILDPDTMTVTFRYSRDEKGLPVAEEINLINRLNDATGRHFDIRHMKRAIVDWYPIELPYIEIRYTMSVDDRVYLTDLLDKCHECMITHTGMFPMSMLVDAKFMIPCMYIINSDPGGIILE